MTPAEIILEPVSAHVGESLRDSQTRLARQLRDRHWTMLWVALIVVTASFMLRVRDGQTVRVLGTDASLPLMCGSRALFGMECPGCGLTRSFIALASGDFGQSLHYHRVGWLLAVAVVAQIPYRIFALRKLRARIVQRTWPVWFGYFLIAALLINWLTRMCGY